jgi:hypothetical protein
MRDIPYTSVEAYDYALESGHINQLELKLVRWLIEYKDDPRGPFTQKEFLNWIVAPKIGSTSWNDIQDYQKSISSLRKKGVIGDLEPRPCKVSKSNRRAHPIYCTMRPPQDIDRMKQSKTKWVLFVQDRTEKTRIFKTKEAAIAWKFKKQVAGVLHEAIEENS